MRTPMNTGARVAFAFALAMMTAGSSAAAADAPNEGDAKMAANAINALGIDLLHQATDTAKNAVLSPYSIQTALAMTYAGADGKTKTEMKTVLHYPDDEAGLDASMGALRSNLALIVKHSLGNTAWTPEPRESIVIDTANRLFGQEGYDFRPAFLDLVKREYEAPLELMDFEHEAEASRGRINAWVEKETRDKIRDLIPSGGVNEDTRLVLTNAIYLKAPWASPFVETMTQPRPFHLANGDSVSVTTMREQNQFGFAQRGGFRIVTLPYLLGDLQLLILVPDEAKGLPELESQLTPDLLAGAAAVPKQLVALDIPKFKIKPPTLPLAGALKALGMKTAFDDPQGSANFDRMAPRRPDDYLKIDAVFHKAFIDVDEKGTEAAAASAVVMVGATSARRPAEPIQVKIDRPFLFAIQHRASGACLFLGRVTDPR